jgi:hypothetical protein
MWSWLSLDNDLLFKQHNKRFPSWKETDMKTITTIRLIIISAIILIAAAACGRLEATNDAEHVNKLASQIADFDAPAGFMEEFSVEMSSYTLASYKGGAGPSHLYIIQSENKADGEELEKMLTEMAPGNKDWKTRMTVIENRPATVRGQEATLVISEGVNHENVTYHQATVAFEGKGGPAMLVFSDTLENWDLEAIEAFLASIQ